MKLAFGVFPNTRELSLPVDLDLFGHDSQSAVFYNYVLDLAWSCVEILRKFVVKIEGEDIGNCSHLH